MVVTSFNSTETFSSALRATAVFTLSDTGDTTVVDQSFSFLNLVPFLIRGRFYVLTDFDLDGDFIDATVNSIAGGTTITQTDGETTGIQQVTGVAPDAFDVGIFPQISNPLLRDEIFINLAGRTTAAGPADFQHALSWDRSLSPTQSFSLALQQSITVPEPAQAWAAALLALALVARARIRPVQWS